jgi:hypothetical protein
LATLLQMSLPIVISARDELLASDLIAHEARFTQVLSLPPAGQHRRSESCQGPMSLGEILRQIAARPHPDRERSVP